MKAQLIHIAGSKGKGSTAHLIAAGLNFAGKKVGLFTSPALFEDTEMIQVNGEKISQDKYDRLFEHFKKKGLSDFEAQTETAVTYFEAQNCEFVVMECGWGGSKDATNLVNLEKVLTILTHVELEHTEVLGKTLTAITREKLGICHEGVPLLTPKKQAPVVIKEIKKKKVPTTFVLQKSMGSHHPESGGLAWEALKVLGVLRSKKLLDHLTSLEIPGRFESVNYGAHELILDGAHTEDSLKFVKKKAEEWAKKKGIKNLSYAVHTLKDKDENLWKIFSENEVTWVPLAHERASAGPKEIPHENLKKILKTLRAESKKQLVVFTGSFRLVAEVKRELSK
ncbi:MAG: Mur ligase family protein [Patescibacteria group bacterium]